VKKFVLLHYGFEKPTPEIMAAWGKWFEATKPHTVDMGGFGNGREISKGGTRDLPLGPDSVTGFTIVNAANLDDAEKMAQGNPFISSIRVYERPTHHFASASQPLCRLILAALATCTAPRFSPRSGR
jgi:hypothetical protein